MSTNSTRGGPRQRSHLSEKALPQSLTRRSFLAATALAAGGLFRPPGMTLRADDHKDRVAEPRTSVASEVLPMGSAPTPLELGHFPDRLHAFVWRNWPLVPCQRMARV